MKRIVNYIFKLAFYLYSFISNKKRILFIPHPGMARNDNYSIMNYHSDCALSFANYILTNKLLADKIITITISKHNDIENLRKYTTTQFPDRKIEFVYSFDAVSSGSIRDIHNRLKFYKAISESSHIFTSITYILRPLFSNKQQIVVDLGYYSCPFKNDLFNKDAPIYMGIDKISEKDCRYYVCASELSIRLILPTMSIPYEKYLNLGMCRNDYLFSDKTEDQLRAKLKDSVNYQVNRIILYTPTHRDYENDKGSTNISRELLGFDADIDSINSCLIANECMIICKLHPKQNKEIISKSLPPSIILHEANEEYGLSELMKASDALITDYTSGYFDYLILNKPVIFNFYDVDIYKKTRGFTFEPIESICAGDIVYDENSFKKAISDLDQNEHVNNKHREIIRNMVFSHQDTCSCERIFEFIFHK